MRSGLPELYKSDSVRLCLIVWDGIGSLGQGSRSGCRNSPMRHTSKPLSSFLLNLHFPVRPDGAYHQWRRVPPGELSIAPVADERFGRATDWAGASEGSLPSGADHRATTLYCTSDRQRGPTISCSSGAASVTIRADAW